MLADLFCWPLDQPLSQKPKERAKQPSTGVEVTHCGHRLQALGHVMGWPSLLCSCRKPQNGEALARARGLLTNPVQLHRVGPIKGSSDFRGKSG